MTRAALVGVTAAGKSALAHDVARATGAVVLCLDSMTVYRHMDIATAKPTPAQRAEVDYRLLDLVDPDEEMSVAQFQREARAASDEALAAGRPVLYVGGTGLYVRAVLDDLEIPGTYPEVRARLEARAATDLPALYARLVELDPLAASRIEPANARRIVRALEVTEGAGRPFSSFGEGLRSYRDAATPQVGLDVGLAEVDARVAARFAAWMAGGLLDEVRALAARPAGLSRTARQAVGYKELLEHVEHGAALAECVAAAVAQTRRLARRQRRWFTRDPRVAWVGDPEVARERLAALLTGADAGVRD
ncbi:MAG TPA: tRNA (adenosine(37)-N6)-dimethylallyltransferase MiaA [Acidimicrobiales bacterium]|nr:tRNA (adenosine(37)-N6)-dimethylallyltransferase MiaA [Acidimicrobiales bacterium]